MVGPGLTQPAPGSPGTHRPQSLTPAAALAVCHCLLRAQTMEPVVQSAAQSEEHYTHLFCVSEEHYTHLCCVSEELVTAETSSISDVT